MNNIDIVEHNREAWNKQVSEDNKWTIPVSSSEVELAKKGEYSIVLTPTKPVPQDWIGDVNGKYILCLASGGGQQGPILAALGAHVTVFDNSPQQLGKDKFVADRDGLDIKLVQGDMKDLSCFNDQEFDLIFHPVSNCFVDNIEPVWKECFRVLKKGGVLLSSFANPIIYIFDLDKWDNGEFLINHSIPYSDVEQLEPQRLKKRIEDKETLEYGHSLESQIGGQLAAGFLLAGFYEDTAGGDMLDPYINTFIALKAIKP